VDARQRSRNSRLDRIDNNLHYVLTNVITALCDLQLHQAVWTLTFCVAADTSTSTRRGDSEGGL
jgi:hypothetical protein